MSERQAHLNGGREICNDVCAQSLRLAGIYAVPVGRNQLKKVPSLAPLSFTP